YCLTRSPRCRSGVVSVENFQKDTRLLLRTRYAPEEIRTRFGKRGQIRFIQLFNLEATVSNERWNVTGDVASLESPFKKRLSPLLPTSHVRVGRKTMLKENKLTARPQDSANPANSFLDVGNSAHRERANNRINAGIVEWNPFSRKIKKLNIQLCAAALFFSPRDHSGVRFQRIDFAHSGWIVMSEVHTGTYADLKHFPLR